LAARLVDAAAELKEQAGELRPPEKTQDFSPNKFF
jgi:hypothetical protein